MLFTSSSRRGLGHLVRGLNIARALRTQEPGLEIVLVTRGDLPNGMIDDSLIDNVCSRPEGADWSEVVDKFDPSLTVWDTMLPERPVAADKAGRNAFIMRRCRSERQASLLQNPDLRAFDRILVPHDEAEFASPLPEDLAARTRFVGPIVRRPQPELIDGLRRLYDLSLDEFVVVSTPGGGGFPDHARDFFAAVRMAHERLVSHLSRLRHLVIAGPRYRGSVLRAQRLRFIEAEPELASLLGLAKVVVASGGYNTVNEIRANGVPAVFLPGKRTHDDQAERVAALEREGLAVVAAGSPERCADTIVATCLDEARLAAMRKAHRARPLVCGNDAAATALLELLPC